jgi:drug/metabolite transporter (DMT)-like permease
MIRAIHREIPNGRYDGDMATAVVLSLLAATCYGVASALQHQAAEEQPPELALRADLLLRLARRPRWLLGNVLDVAGYAFQLLALRKGPLTLVEPLLVVSLLVAFPVAARLGHRRISATETGVATAVAAGLGLFLAVARPSPGGSQASTTGLIALTVVAAVVVGGSVLLSRGADRSRAGVLLAAGGGVAFGYMAAATSLGWRVLDRGFLHIFTSWELYAVVVSGVAGILLTQTAYSSGVLRLSLPTLTVVQPVAAVAIGLLLFGERIDSGGLAPLWEALGLVVMTVGVYVLARLE